MIDLNTADIKMCIDLNPDGTKKKDRRFLYDGASTLEITSGENDEVLLLSAQNKCNNTYYIYSRQGDYKIEYQGLITIPEIVKDMKLYIKNDESAIVDLVEAFIEYSVFF